MLPHMLNKKVKPKSKFHQYISERYLKNKEFRSKLNKKMKISEYYKNNELDLEKVIDEYSGYVYKIVENMAIEYLSKEDVEELISDTFVVLWKNREKLDITKDLSPYIAGITKNLVREKSRVIKINSNIDDYENIIHDFFKIDMFCEQREKIAIIDKALKNMKKIDIEIFELYYYSSMKYNEISGVLNVSEFTIKSKLFRIRKKIKKELLKGGYSDEEL